MKKPGSSNPRLTASVPPFEMPGVKPRLIRISSATVIAILWAACPMATFGEDDVNLHAAVGGLETQLTAEPVTVAPSRLTAVMSSIDFTVEGFMAEKRKRPVFSEEQIHVLAPMIRRSLQQIRGHRVVDFRTDGLHGRVLHRKGTLYWHFLTINHRPARRIYRLNESTSDLDEEKGDQTDNRVVERYWRLIPSQGQSLYKDRPDWLETPMGTGGSPRSKQTHQQSTAKASPQPARPGAGTGGDLNARMTKLRALLAKGLIDRKDYDDKVASMIEEYESAHPAIEDRLEFLRYLHDAPFISDEVYARHKKRLLDAL